MISADFWVMVSFAIFIAAAVYFRAPALIIAALDKRARQIADELEEARKLREDAQHTLAGYQRRQRDAEKDAQGILTQAKAEAERMAAEARQAMTERLQRRARLAQEKIAQAEAQALADVRAAAAAAAIAEARAIIAAHMDPAKARALMEDSIRRLPERMG